MTKAELDNTNEVSPEFIKIFKFYIISIINKFIFIANYNYVGF